MKKLLLLATACTFSSFLLAQKKVSDVAKFETEVINQGNLKQNEPKEVKFIVTNIGKEPLIIEQASPTCGCTVGDYTKSPIAPGATGFISAKFNAANVGHFDKHLTVKFAGVDETKSITITGNVLESAEYEKWAAEMNDTRKKEKAEAQAPAPAVKSNKPAAKNSMSKNNNN